MTCTENYIGNGQDWRWGLQSACGWIISPGRGRVVWVVCAFGSIGDVPLVLVDE